VIDRSTLAEAINAAFKRSVDGPLLVCNRFGFTPEHRPLLLELASTEPDKIARDVLIHLAASDHEIIAPTH
jgi:hypothetical protein